MATHAKRGKERGSPSPQAQPSGIPVDASNFDERKKESSQKGSSNKVDEQEAPPSRHLWVGNVSSNVTEAMLAEQFARFGDLENVSVYSARNYAFINFRNEEDAIYAKKGLQGVILGGLALRIEYAKGAKPCRHLWIGGICSSITKEQLEEELKAFGVVEDLRFMRDYDSACVEFLKTEDAIAAYEALNRRKLGKEELRVEYSKPQQEPKWDVRYETQHQVVERMIQWDLQMLSGAKGFQMNGIQGESIRDRAKEDRDGENRPLKDKDVEPSEVLWVGYPMYMKVDERSLRKAFSPFGEIERITTFPGRTYAFVQFFSIKAASRAKNALQGRLFNEPRVTISFAKSEIGPVDDKRGANNNFSSSPIKGRSAHAGTSLNIGPYQRNDRYLGLYPPSISNKLSPGYGNTIDRVDVLEASIHHSYGTELNTGMASELTHVSRITSEHGRPPQVEFWNNAIPERDALVYSGPGLEEHWNNHEEDILKRELKRHKIGKETLGEFPNEVRSNEFKVERQPSYSLLPHSSLTMSEVNENLGSKLTAITSLSEHWQHQGDFKQGFEEVDSLKLVNTDFSRAAHKDDWPISEGYLATAKDGWKWQGTIAKSGTPICQARCSAVGKPVDITFPNVVNCTARTNLELLAKHINQAVDFGVVFFVPYSDLDVGPYQEFLFYLTDKKRAAVCRLSDDATLFLVPPSEFVEQILKVHRSTHVFGVVLKLYQLQNQNSKVLREQIPAPHQFVQIQSSLLSTRRIEENQHPFVVQEPPERRFLDPRMPRDANLLMTARPTDLPLPQERAVSLPSLLPRIPQSSIVAATVPVQAVGSIPASSVSASIPCVAAVQGNLLFKNQAGPLLTSNHASGQDALIPYLQGWAPIEQEHQNSMLVNNFNLASSEPHAFKVEQGSAVQLQGVFPPLQMADAHGLSGNAQFQHPKPPPFLLPSMQLPPCDQPSSMTSALSHQQQSQLDPGAILQQSVHTQVSSNVQPHIVPQNVQLSNVSLALESMSVHPSQVPIPPHLLLSMTPAFTQGGSLVGAVETSKMQEPQTEQQHISSQNQPSTGLAENQKRFQATLQLAAALLEQLQQRKA